LNERPAAGSGSLRGQTAAYLGISRKNLWEKMKRLQIAAKAPEDEPR